MTKPRRLRARGGVDAGSAYEGGPGGGAPYPAGGPGGGPAGGKPPESVFGGGMLIRYCSSLVTRRRIVSHGRRAEPALVTPVDEFRDVAHQIVGRRVHRLATRL